MSPQRILVETGPVQRSAYVTRQEALDILGVKPQTLYSYVSRGLVRRRVEKSGRPSYYNVQDIQRLKSRSLARSGHGPAAANAIHWGEPVLGTGITEITAQGPLYREHAAVDLAQSHHRFEAVAEYLWTGSALLDDVMWPVPRYEGLGRQLDDIAGLHPSIHIRQLLTEVTLLLGMEPGSNERRDGAEIDHARQLMQAMVGAFGFLGPSRRYCAPKRGETIARSLARALAIRPSDETLQALDGALVLVADHELTPATFAARIAASAGSDLHSCIGAALQVHFGSALGLRCDLVEQYLATSPASAEGASLAPISSVFYPDGDPRVAVLMNIVTSVETAARSHKSRPSAAADARQGSESLDHALVTLCHALGTVGQAAGGLLAFGRTAGWIAHVFEQRRDGLVIRPRAKFVPRRPGFAN
jgi:citrate synthase